MYDSALRSCETIKKSPDRYRKDLVLACWLHRERSFSISASLGFILGSSSVRFGCFSGKSVLPVSSFVGEHIVFLATTDYTRIEVRVLPIHEIEVLLTENSAHLLVCADFSVQRRLTFVG